ncbi:uncharacterized protein LOC116043426 isoform X2 [Sander lucioperca]|uniref:uncharacterized protein LOC116043426 isoform X2 n=1 Tax=Sander lucioperca TaxID=283035 RepID=UPI00125D464B|nr:uncharacterized protein LOC116043426 isoform X2 [Sander lucioperca]
MQPEACCNTLEEGLAKRDYVALTVGIDRQTRGGTRSPKSTELLQNLRSAASGVSDRCKTSLKREIVADIVTMEAAVVEEGISPAQSPLVAVSFQRNVHRNKKYLEAEPKALGITQIGLSLFQIICVGVFLSKGLSFVTTDIPLLISSILVIIAGSVAVAAQNLHLPTLRACLGMQVVASGASLLNMICILIKMDHTPSFCWNYYYHNATVHWGEICHQIESIHSHIHAEGIVIEAALLAISITLAAYSCKVINCCSPASKMPVITVQAPPVQH